MLDYAVLPGHAHASVRWDRVWACVGEKLDFPRLSTAARFWILGEKSSGETLLAWTPKGLVVGEYDVTATLADLTAILQNSHDFELTSRDALGAAWLFDFLPHYAISAQVLDLPYQPAVALPHDLVLARVPLVCRPL